MNKKSIIVIAIISLFVLFETRYQWLWDSSFMRRFYLEKRQVLQLSGWPRMHGTFSKMIDVTPTENLVIGSSHTRQLNISFLPNEPERFFYNISNFAFQLYFEKDLILKNKPKKIYFIFAPGEFKYDFRDENPYFTQPVRLSDLLDQYAFQKTAEYKNLSENAKEHIQYLNRWMLKNYFLQWTYFDLLPNILINDYITNVFKKDHPEVIVKRKNDDIRSHLNRTEDLPEILFPEQIKISFYYIDKLFQQLTAAGIEVNFVEIFMQASCINKAQNLQREHFFKNIHGMNSFTKINFFTREQLPQPKESQYESCFHIIHNNEGDEFNKIYKNALYNLNNTVIPKTDSIQKDPQNN